MMWSELKGELNAAISLAWRRLEWRLARRASGHGTPPAEAMSSFSPAPPGQWHDGARQVLTVVLAVAQLVAIGVSVIAGPGQDLGSGRASSEPPVVPALYTFSVWFVIYAGALAFAAYQGTPRRRTRRALRTLGFAPAVAFGGTTLWAVVQALGLDALTVPCMFAMLGGLITSLVRLRRPGIVLTSGERRYVWLPLGIFAGYVTLAAVANVSSVLAHAGVHDLGIGETPWAVIMLLVAGLIAALMTRFLGRGGTAYALTVVWGLIGVVVANVVDLPNLSAALASGGAALMVLVALRGARMTADFH